LSAEVARTYVQIRTFEVLIAQARQNTQIQEEGLDIAESRLRHGATSELDVAQQQNLLETTRATIPVYELGLVQARNALSTLLGQPTGGLDVLLCASCVIPAPPSRVAIGVPADLLRRRPDIRAAEFRAMAQCQRIGIAKAELYPKLVLFGSVGTLTSTATSPLASIMPSSFRALFTPGTLAFNAGGSVFWPILSYPRIFNNVRIEDARFQQALVDYANTILKAAQEVEDGLTGFLRQQDAAALLANAVTSGETAVKLAMVQYRE